MLFTAKDGCEFIAPVVSGGQCTTGAAENPVVLARLNEAIRRLMRKNDPATTVKWVRFCTYNNSITLPYEGLAVVGEPIIDGSPRLAFGTNYEFLPGGPGFLPPGSGWGKDLVDTGFGWPVFFDIPTDAPRHLVAFSTHAEDIGKIVRVCGRDEYAAEIFSAGTPGIDVPISRWKQGVEGTVSGQVALPQSAVKVQQITAVHKDATRGYISLYTYEAATQRMYFLAKYHPDEETPGYRRYKIAGADFDNGTSVIVRMKLQYVPLKYAKDILLIQDLDALKIMSQGIEYENAGKIQEAEACEARATRLLSEQKQDMRETMPALQITDTAIPKCAAHLM